MRDSTHPLRASTNFVRAASQPAVRFEDEVDPGDLIPQDVSIEFNPHEIPDLQIINTNPRQNQFATARHIQTFHQLPEITRNQSLASGIRANRPHQTMTPSLFAFRQESLRGSRMIHIPSALVLPETPSQSEYNNPSNDNNPAVAIPIQNIVDNHANSGDNNHSHHDDRQIEVEAPPQVTSAEDQSIKRAATWRIISQFTFNLFILVSYVLAYLYLKDIISYNVLFGYGFGSILVYMFGIIIGSSTTPNEEPIKRIFGKLLSLCNAAAVLVYLIMLFIKFKGTNIPMVPFSLIGVMVMFCACGKSSIDTPGPSDIIFLMMQTVGWIELFLMALRFDGLAIPWGTIFIPLYFALMLLAFSSILIIMGSLFAFIGIMREEGFSGKLLVGSFWYVLNALYTGIWLGLISEGVKLLDDGYGRINIPLEVGIAHSGAILLYTIGFCKLLKRFQEFEIQSEMLVADEEVVDVNRASGEEGVGQVRFQVSKEKNVNLIMVSPSFFTYFRNQFKSSNRQIERLKKDVERAKLDKHRNVLAVTNEFNTEVVAPTDNLVFSPIKTPAHKNLDYSEGDIRARQNIPLTVFKKSESVNSNENLCTICYDMTPNAVFMDCGHGGICYECALETWKKSDLCYLCRAKINKVLKIIHLKPLNIIKVVESTQKVIESV